MRKQLSDIEETDRYLLRAMPEADRLLFEAQCLASPILRQQVKHQQQVHRLVRWFARDAQRQRLAAVAARLDADPVFRQAIADIFK